MKYYKLVSNYIFYEQFCVFKRTLPIEQGGMNIMINVYEQCPVYKTESFILRLVKIEDAEALLKCYSDKDTVSKMNSDYCTSDFFYTTKNEMEQCIRQYVMTSNL